MRRAPIALASLVLLTLFACGDDPADADAGPDAGDDSADAGIDGAGADAEVPDVNCAPHTFTHDGVARFYILCAPTAPSGDLPVLLGFHGGGGNAAQWYNGVAWHERAPGIVTVYLQGCREGETDCDDIAGGYLWNIGKPGEDSSVDDAGFTFAVLERLRSVHELDIDSTRIFATGHSLGGMFTYTLRCDYPDAFAAIAPISAVPSDGTCDGASTTPILHVHGGADTNVPFDTGCCSLAQQRSANASYLPDCDTLPRCFNPTNWWPPGRDGAHPYADLLGLDEMASAMGCGTGRTEVSGTPCVRYEGCLVELCLVDDAEHSLSTFETRFDYRGHILERFAALP